MGCVPSRGTRRVAAEPHDVCIPTVLEKAGFVQSFMSEGERHQNSLLEAAEEEGAAHGSTEGWSTHRSGIARVLMIGAGAVGKTTLVRSLAHHYDGAHYGAPEAAIVGAHLIFLLREVLNAMRQLDLQFEDAELAKRAQEITHSQIVDSHSELIRYAADFARITSEASVGAVLDRAEEMQLSSHARWFFAEQGRILSPGYSPSVDDMLRLRVRTTGVGRHRVSSLLCFFLLHQLAARYPPSSLTHDSPNHVALFLPCIAVSKARAPGGSA